MGVFLYLRLKVFILIFDSNEFKNAQKCSKPSFKSIRDSKSRSSVTDRLSPQSLEFCWFLSSSLNQNNQTTAINFNSVRLIRYVSYLFGSGINFEIRGIDSHIFEEQKLSMSPSIVTCLTSIDTGNFQTCKNCCWNRI